MNKLASKIRPTHVMVTSTVLCIKFYYIFSRRHKWLTTRGWRQAAGRWRGGRRPNGSGRVRERVVVRALGRQLGSAIRGSGRVRGRVVISASGQAAGAARISKT